MPKRRLDHPRPWHRGSIYGDGLRRPLDRNRRARWRFLVRTHARAGRLTPKAEWVLGELEVHLARDGRCDPSHERLATGADVSVSTVERALREARALGLVGWQRRIVRAGWRAEQTTNAYVLDPAGEPAPLPVLVPTLRAKNLESGFSRTLTVGAPVLAPAPDAMQLARLAARFAEERRRWSEGFRRARSMTS